MSEQVCPLSGVPLPSRTYSAPWRARAASRWTRGCLLPLPSSTRPPATTQPAQSGEEPATVRGTNFSPLEDLALARCFLRASQCVTDMDAEQMWDKLATLYAAQPEAGAPRTAHSLRCRWSPLQRAAQKYIAADKLYRAAIPSGQSEADVIANGQELYRRSNKTKGKVAPVFKSTDAAAQLATSPKFSGAGAAESACAGGRPAVSATGGPASVEGSSAAGGTDDSPRGRSAVRQDSPRPSSLRVHVLTSQKEIQMDLTVRRAHLCPQTEIQIWRYR